MGIRTALVLVRRHPLLPPKSQPKVRQYHSVSSYVTHTKYIHMSYGGVVRTHYSDGLIPAFGGRITTEGNSHNISRGQCGLPWLSLVSPLQMAGRKGRAKFSTVQSADCRAAAACRRRSQSLQLKASTMSPFSLSLCDTPLESRLDEE